MTDWNAWLACDVCGVLKGERCLTMSSGGPEALPPRYADVPHSCREPAGVRTVTAPRPTAARTANPARRQAKRTAAKVTSWQQVADRQRARRT